MASNTPALNDLLLQGLDVVQDAIAGTSKTQYRRCWSEWLKFCALYDLAPLDATPENLVSYLAYVSQKFSTSVSTAYTHLSSVAYNYRINGKASITEATVVSMYMKGLKRRNAHVPLKQAIPMTVDVLSDLRKLLVSDPRLVVWRTVWRIHIEFGLLLRFDDIKRLKTGDVTFEENSTGKFARIKLHGGKTSSACSKNKNDRILTPNGLDSCLYEITKRYLSYLAGHRGSLQPGCSPADPNKPHPTKSICYTIALQDLKNVIDKSGHDGRKYTEHSNKRGGATHAANSGISENVIQEVGNWKSLKTTRLYIDQNTPLRQKRNLTLQKLI